MKKATDQTKRRSIDGPRADDRSVHQVMTLLEKKGSAQTRNSLAKYGIDAPQSFGVTVAALRKLAKSIGSNHALAIKLWDTGWYEARMLATFIGEPEKLTAKQMDDWCKNFDNWAIVDTACFALFDRSRHAWKKAAQWTSRAREFEKRAGFALFWSLSVHDKSADDASFTTALQHIEREAEDDRHFVKKGINMALRAIGKRNATLNAAAIECARRLSESKNSHARWIGADALRELTSTKVTQRLKSRRK